ncbi:MAG: hypothetical protein K6D59_07215 [Bacteroidales bacterium]|nr:hypothetical protein [Bacteroidales bacterium]
MKRPVRNILIAVLVIAIVITFHTVRRNSIMRGLETIIVGNQKECLLSVADVDSLIMEAYPTLKEEDIKNVDCDGVEKMLEAHPYIEEASVGMTTGGKMKTEVTPAIPVVRLFYQGNEYYLSYNGRCLPLAARHYRHIIVGNVESEEPQLHNITALNLADTSNHKQPESLMKIWKMATFLHDNSQYDDVFDQICIDESGDICIVPKLGDMTVVVGDTNDLDKKFENLWTFFEQGISQTGWDTYSVINLKYRDQVVCTKRKR